MHEHPRLALVPDGPCQVEQCDCGVLHVTLGMLTLRLQPSTAHVLASALQRALAITGVVSLDRPRLHD